MQTYNKYKKQYQKDQQTIQVFDKLYEKILQDNPIDKSEYDSQCSIFTKNLSEMKNESLL